MVVFTAVLSVRLEGHRTINPNRALPEAVLRFRQGVGRLIRRADDRGALVVCDPRLARASYRRAFTDVLPVAPRALRDPRAVADEVRRFFEEDVVVGRDA